MRSTNTEVIGPLVGFHVDGPRALDIGGPNRVPDLLGEAVEAVRVGPVTHFDPFVVGRHYGSNRCLFTPFVGLDGGSHSFVQRFQEQVDDAVAPDAETPLVVVAAQVERLQFRVAVVEHSVGQVPNLVFETAGGNRADAALGGRDDHLRAGSSVGAPANVHDRRQHGRLVGIQSFADARHQFPFRYAPLALFGVTHCTSSIRPLR